MVTESRPEGNLDHIACDHGGFDAVHDDTILAPADCRELHKPGEAYPSEKYRLLHRHRLEGGRRMKQTKYTNEEIGRIGTETIGADPSSGDATVQRQIFILDIASGDYEIDDDDTERRGTGYVPDVPMGCSSGCVSAIRRHMLSQGG